MPNTRTDPESGLPQSLNTLHGGGLAGTIRPDDPEDLTRLDLERNTVNGRHLAIVLSQVIHDQSVLHRNRTLSEVLLRLDVRRPSRPRGTVALSDEQHEQPPADGRA